MFVLGLDSGYTVKYNPSPSGVLSGFRQYIILKDGILRFYSFNITSQRGYISQYTPLGVYGLIVHEINQVNIILMIVKNYIMSVLGLDSGYTVKYTPSPSGVPQGFALGNSFSRRGIFDHISLLSSYNTDTIFSTSPTVSFILPLFIV